MFLSAITELEQMLSDYCDGGIDVYEGDHKYEGDVIISNCNWYWYWYHLIIPMILMIGTVRR